MIHIRRLGAICIALGIVNALVTCLYFTVLDREILLVQYVPAIVTLVWMVLMGVLAVPQIIAGVGLLRLKPWARSFGMILLTFSLLDVPLGTAAGLYGLSVLMSPEADDLFSPRFYRKFL